MYTIHREKRNKRKVNDIAMDMDTVLKGNIVTDIQEHNAMPVYAPIELIIDKQKAIGKGILTVKGV